MSLSELFESFNFRDGGTGRLDAPVFNNVGLAASLDLFLSNRFSVLGINSNPINVPAIPGKQYIVTFISVSAASPDAENIRFNLQSNVLVATINLATGDITGRSQTVQYSDQYIPLGIGQGFSTQILPAAAVRYYVGGFIQ